ncbi:hypothetical protein [Amycolatopsis sp. NPDC021455]|uniref:hypothetical protein n=1 Tax=Amycolatopsis sp. NPDC021455 TaxID=3154901 RepID=UPI0033DA32AE
MSTTFKQRLATRAGVGLATAGLVAAGLMVAGGTASAACKSGYVHAGSDYSYAEAHTEDCSWESRSYAQHGNVYADSGWWTGYSWARADAGTSSSFYAANYFR